MMHFNTNGFQTEKTLKNNRQCSVKDKHDKHKDDRIPIVESLYVIIDTQPQTMGQVVEIGSTGMAFTFVDLDAVSKRLSEKAIFSLDLFAGGKGFFVKDVACSIVSKIEKISSSSNPPHSIKRVDVKFEQLSVLQQVQINQLVRQFSRLN